MAASSPSTYDVFLSFRGVDTRKTFVDHLYIRLELYGIHTFKDDEILHKGDCIHPSLMKAIEESKIAIVVFSEHYGDSSACMQELAHIMKCKDDPDQELIVLSVFYDVTPENVKEQTGDFGVAFSTQLLSKNSRNVESWITALKSAVKLVSYELKNMNDGLEGANISTIVTDVSEKLGKTKKVLNEDLIGIETRKQDVMSHLKVELGGVRMVGIWGIGGGGKTTLASSIYKELEFSGKFDSCCFVGNIREECDKFGLRKLQKKFILDVLKLKKVTLWSIEEGRLMIKERLGRKKVLIVLDDVVIHDHLEALAGSRDWFGEGSRIIITTRDQHLLNAHHIDETYNISLLDTREAIHLFYKHVLWNNRANDHIQLVELSEKVIYYAGGVPLVLKLLGLFLCDKDISEWESTLTRLKDIPNGDYVQKLKISYDGLKPVEQELFLDIACFFLHWPKYEAMNILDACGFHAVVGVKVLLQKALINDTKGNFSMHNVVQEMAYYIVQGKHTENPEKHSRVWRYRDIENMCALGATMENNKIQVLHIAPDHDAAPSNLLKAVANMKKLRLLNVNQNVKEVVKSPEFISGALRWLSWRGYPANSLPTNFQPTKLVGLILKNGLQKELWSGIKELPNLKVLDVSDSKNLTTTPDFKGLPNLEELLLSGCSDLVKVHSSIGWLKKLIRLYLDDCVKIQMFPSIVTMPKLETLVFSGCSQLREFPEIKETMDGLRYLKMNNSGINVVPSSIDNFCPNLVSVSAMSCTKLGSTSFIGRDHQENIESNVPLSKRRWSMYVGKD